MAFNFGQVDYFSDPMSYPNPVIEALARAITLPRFKGVVYQNMGAPYAPITNKQYDVYSRSKSTRNGNIGSAWGASATTGLSMPAQFCNGLTIGHELKIDDEIVVISHVDRSANTVDVFERGRSGTAAAAHAANAPFTVIGFASRDADLKNTEGVTENTLKRINYVKTVYELLDWEKGAELERQGISSDNIIPLLQQEAGLRVAETLSYMAIHSRKHLGTRNSPYSTSGLLASLVDKGVDNSCPIQVYDADSNPINENMLHAALDQVFTYGSPDSIILSLDNSNKFKFWHGHGLDVTIGTTRADHGVGRWVDHYDYNGVSLKLVIDADMPNDKIAIVTSADLKKGWLVNDMLTTKTEPAPSTREFRESIQGTLGFLVENVGYSHILIENLTI